MDSDEIFHGLPVSQQLALEVLAARYRLGEMLWTFSTKTKPALVALESAGYVRLMHGIVSRSVRASLTAKGRALVLSQAYEAPHAPR